MKPSPIVLLTKRSFDLAAGLAGTVAFLASYPILAALIKLESPGPALYRQVRVGANQRRRRGKADAGDPRRRVDYGGRPFTIFKYRTMRMDAEANGPQLAAKGLDPRVTRIGKWLRALHLDELPQFWNILKGDMSFIGPRPERPHFTAEYGKTVPHYHYRTLFAKPGLTGLAQITVGYDDSLESVVRKSHYDLSYIASFHAFLPWLRMEAMILIHTFLYLGKPPRFEGETRDLAGLRRARMLRFTGRSPAKSGPPVPQDETGSVYLHRTPTSVVMVGRSPSEIGDKLEGLDFSGSKSLEVRLNTDASFDLEDLGFLINLAHKVRERGGRLSVRNRNPRVRKMLKEIRFDNVVEFRRPFTSVRNFLTVDVECWFHAHNLKAQVPQATWHLQQTRVVSNVARILDLLRAHQAKATFFVLGWVADHFPEVVKMIDAEGHELGTHGYYHSLITDMTPVQFEEDLAKSLEALARYSSQKVIGHRASNFSVVHNTLWALEILNKYGIEYDSSIFPVARKRYGIPDYPNRLPHEVRFEDGTALKEIPMSTLGLGKRLLPISGGGYLRLYPYRVTHRYIEQKNRAGLPAMVYFHPWELDMRQPRLKVGYLSTFQHYVNLESTEWKISRLLESFDFCSVRENLQSARIKNLLKRNPVAVVTLKAQGAARRPEWELAPRPLTAQGQGA